MLNIIERAPQAMEVPDSVSIPLYAHIRLCWEEAKTTRMEVTERLLRCERQRRGEYDPDMRALIAEQGGSDIYMMLTDVKCRAAESWIKDVMLSADRTWTLAPTSEPALPDEFRMGIIEMVTIEAMQAQQQGNPLNQGVIAIRLEEVYKEVTSKLKEATGDTINRMVGRMDDILQEAKWVDTLSQIIYDFTTFPYAIIKGPFAKRRRQLRWGKNFRPIVDDVVARDFTRVSPYDAFWAPNATGPNDGAYFIERIKMTRAAVSALQGLPGVNNDEVAAVLDTYGKGGLREWLYSDMEQDFLKGKSSQAQSSTDIIEGLSFWGSVSGSLLRQWGMKDVEEHKEYEVNAWLFGRNVVLCRLNPDPLGQRPYSKECWESIPGAFAGKALPELMRDTQAMCNAAARSLANNMAMASGPMVEVTVDRLAKGEQMSDLYPWRQFQTNSDRSGSGQPAIRFFQPDMNAEALLNVFQFFQKTADEVTGVPNYVYGSSSVSGAGRTAAGLSMLMENAAKGIKTAILSLDKATSEVIVRLYNHLMLFDKDPSIKADAQVVATGVVATLMKDQIHARRQEFLASVSNPIDVNIVTPDRRAYLLREQAKTLNLDIDKLVPEPEQIRQQMNEAKRMQEAQAMAAQQQAQPQPMPSGPQPLPQGMQ